MFGISHMFYMFICLFICSSYVLICSYGYLITRMFGTSYFNESLKLYIICLHNNYIVLKWSFSIIMLYTFITSQYSTLFIKIWPPVVLTIDSWVVAGYIYIYNLHKKQIVTDIGKVTRLVSIIIFSSVILAREVIE